MSAPWLDARTGAPKGFAPYRPQAEWKRDVIDDVLDHFDELSADDALPIGPRTAGYGLSQRVNRSGLRFTKGTHLREGVVYPHPVQGGRKTEAVLPGWATFKDVEDAIKRLRQSEQLPWHWVSDG